MSENVHAEPGVRLSDHTDLAKVLVRADPGRALATRLGVPCGHAARDGDDALVVRTAPDAWLLLAPAGTAAPVVRRLEALGADEFASVVDLTHGCTLVRLIGSSAVDVLATLCAIDLADDAAPNGSAFRSVVAGITATVVRDDERTTQPHDDEHTTPSYLVLCDRSYGQYLVEVLTDAFPSPALIMGKCDQKLVRKAAFGHDQRA